MLEIEVRYLAAVCLGFNEVAVLAEQRGEERAASARPRDHPAASERDRRRDAPWTDYDSETQYSVRGDRH